MPKRILVIGLGRFGAALAASLAEHGCEVVAVDRDLARVDLIKDRVGYAVALDAGDPDALRAVDPAACAGAIVAIGEDFESAVLCVAALRECGVGRILARAHSARQGRILAAVGAAGVLEVETEMGRRMGRALAEDGEDGWAAPAPPRG